MTFDLCNLGSLAHHVSTVVGYRGTALLELYHCLVANFF